MKIAPPVQPFRGTRGVDSWGSGNFGASRDGGKRFHSGLDFVSVPGDEVVSPISGRVSTIGIAYPGSALGSLHIEGSGDHAGCHAKLLYVDPYPIRIGDVVSMGEIVGVAQDVAGYWRGQEPEHPGENMRNHVHLELSLTDAQKVDPAHYLPDSLVIQKDLTA